MNACWSATPSPGSWWRVDLPGGERRVLASGLRSPWDALVLAGRTDRGRRGRPAPDRRRRRRGGPVGGAGRQPRGGTARRPGAASAPGAAERAHGTRRRTPSPSPTRRCPRSASSATARSRRSSEPGSSTGGPPTAIGDTARLQHPLGVAALPDGSIAVADTFNSLLRVWTDGVLRTTAAERAVDEPGGVDVLPDGRLVVADTNHHRVITVDLAHRRRRRDPDRRRGRQDAHAGTALSGARGRQARAQRRRRPGRV